VAAETSPRTAFLLSVMPTACRKAPSRFREGSEKVLSRAGRGSARLGPFSEPSRRGHREEGGGRRAEGGEKRAEGGGGRRVEGGGSRAEGGGKREEEEEEGGGRKEWVEGGRRGRRAEGGGRKASASFSSFEPVRRCGRKSQSTRWLSVPPVTMV